MGTNQFTGPEYELAKIEALRLWLGGASYVAIAEIQGVADTTASARVQAGLDDMRPHGELDSYRARQMAEMEQVRQRLMRLVLAGEDIIEAARELRGLWIAEQKLLKLDEGATALELEIARLRKLSDEELVVEAFGKPAEELRSDTAAQS